MSAATCTAQFHTMRETVQGRSLVVSWLPGNPPPWQPDSVLSLYDLAATCARKPLLAARFYVQILKYL